MAGLNLNYASPVRLRMWVFCALLAGAGGTSTSALAQQPRSGVSAVSGAEAIASAPEVDLRITYSAMSVGTDGVQRDSVYSNRVYRRSGKLWIERELPEALKHSMEHGHAAAHGPHSGHAHEDARSAPLMLTRDAQSGSVRVQLVLRRETRLIDVDEAHHANVGYGGSFDNAYWIVPPSAIQGMQRVGAVKDGVQSYRSQHGEQITLVDWDVRGQYARRVERKDLHGLERIVVSAKPVPGGLGDPWKSTQGFDRGDYSDLLD